MVLKKGVVWKFNFLKIILGNFKRPWIILLLWINLGSCDVFPYPIHPKFKSLPFPHGGMSIHCMDCHMKYDWLANFFGKWMEFVQGKIIWSKHHITLPWPRYHPSNFEGIWLVIHHPIVVGYFLLEKIPFNHWICHLISISNTTS